MGHEVGRDDERPHDEQALTEAPQGWQGLLREQPGPAMLGRLQRSAGNTSVLRMLGNVAPPPVARAPAAQPKPLLVDDGTIAPGEGRMAIGAFLDAVHASASAVAERELGELFRRRGCPWLDHWVAHYRTQPPAKVEEAVRRYAPAAAGATTADEYVDAIRDRVRQGIVQWRATQQVPDVPADGPGAPPGEALPAGGGAADDKAAAGGGGGAAAVNRPAPAFKLAPGAAQPTPEAASFTHSLGRGEPLDGAVGGHVASAFGADLGAVRVHRDARTAQAVAGLGARAVTVGSDIAFAPGEYEPGTLVGDALIAHELAHVVQQQGGAGTATASEAHERDADQAALGAVAGRWGAHDLAGAAGPRLPASGLSLQRCPSREVLEGERLAKDLGLEIVGEPELPDQVPVGTTAAYFMKQRVRHAGDISKGSSWYVDPPGPAKFKKQKSAGNRTSVTFDQPGNWRILCEFGDARKRYAIWHDQEVVEEGVMAQEAFARTGEADYVRHRLTLGDALRKQSKGGELDQDFGGPYIENISAKKANPIEKHSSDRQTFRAKMPSDRPRPTRYRWWMIPHNEIPESGSTYATRQDVHRKTEYKGKFALFLGEGETASTPLKIASEMEIVCEMIGEDGKLAGTARYTQVVVDHREMKGIKALQELVEGTTKHYAKLKPGTARGLRASHLDHATGQASQLKLFVGAHADGETGELLVDLTPGAKKVEYEGDSVEEAITDFEENNDYPAGRIDILNPDTRLQRMLRTKGKSDIRANAEKAGVGSLVLGALGVASAFLFPPAAPYIFVAAAAVGTAGGTMSILDELRKANPNATLVAIDAMSIVASLAGAG